MKTSNRKNIVGVLVVSVLVLVMTLSLVLGVGLPAIKWGTNSNEIAELSENDFEFNYVSSLAYRVSAEDTSGGNGVYGWGYKPDRPPEAEYAFITGIKNTELKDLKTNGVEKLVINIPATHNGVPVRYVAQDAFYDCSLSIVDINMPLSVYWQIKGKERFTFDNNSPFARADGETATFTEFKSKTGSDVTTLVLPSNVWIDKDSDGNFEDGEPTYRYTEYLFKGESSAAYKNLVVMPDVVNIFNGTASESNANRPKLQGGLLSKSQNLQSVYFCTGRSQVLHLYPLTFENCTELKEISLSAGVYLEDGARVFQGASSLEKFYIADEKTASAPFFYTVGADGALYTNNYAYSYFTQSSAERYYEWWKNGLTAVGEWKDSYASEWIPTKAWDSQTNVGSLSLTDPEKPNQMGTFNGDKSASSTPSDTTVYYAQGSDGEYNKGVGIPEGSYVFDVNGTDKNGSTDSENDFEKSSTEGQYEDSANFDSAALTTVEKGDKSGIKAELEATGGVVRVTEKGGNTQTAVSVNINDVEYKSRMQLKQGSTRYIKIEVPFEFDLCAYFAGGYYAAAAGDTKPQIALFGSGKFNETNYSNKEYVGSKAKTAITGDAIAFLEDVDGLSISGGADHLLKIEGNTLQKGTYYIAQPADDEITSDYAQMLFLVITPAKEQAAVSISVEQNISLTSDSEDWKPVQNDALLLKRVTDSYYLDLRYPSIVRYDKTCELKFRVKALAANGEILRSQDIDWAIMDVNGMDVSNYFHMQNPQDIDTEGFFEFTLRLENVFSDSDLYGGGQKHGRNFAVKFTAGECEQYLFINLMPDMDEKKIPDADQWQEGFTSGTEVSYLPLTEEKLSRYQTLVSMPAMAKNDADDYVNSFDFGYHETMEIGPNAFQNTYITVIDIPDRIAKIGASAFRFSSHLQTVYLPDDADIGLNAFGQEADADTVNNTVYTAGKKNFFLIAPSRTSFEHYLMYAAKYYESGQKEQYEPNYNVFPVHVEKEDLGFDERAGDAGRGKDASYDYTPYLTYEITVNFLTYDTTGEKLQKTETRTFLYGMDARFVKATTTTEWANFDRKYDNNAPVWFGYISDNTVQQINTISKRITWSIAADGWYYDENATLPKGDWYFGEQPVTSAAAEERMNEFTKFIGGWAGGYVNSKDIQNLVQLHYAAVYDASYVQGITETGGEPGELRMPIEYSGYGDDFYFPYGDFETETRWNRWWWDEKFDEGGARGAVVQRFFTMPFAITLKNKSEVRESRVDFDVPTFQNIGVITNDEDTMNAVPGADSSWRVPMLTVTFDYNGFPASRIFENFKSYAMDVEYEAWRGLDYADKEWRWTPDTYSSSVGWNDYDKMKYAPDGADYVPYDAGYYRITVRFSESGLDSYKYYWSGVYNGMRVDENADFDDTFTFILHIEPRKVPLSNIYSMQYTGQGFSLFADNPYIDVMSYGYWDSEHAEYTAEGLPCAVGFYNIKLKLNDPKYPNPNDDYLEDINKYTPNLEWEGASGYNDGYYYTMYEENNDVVSRYVYKTGVDLFIFDGAAETQWGSLHEEGPNGEEIPITFDAPLAIFNSEVLTYTYTGAPFTIEDIFGGVFSSSSINYTITRNEKAVTEIKNAGTYIVSITPAEGYVWWRGIPTIDEKAKFLVDEWSLDEFWAKRGGYEANKTTTLTFEVNIDKSPVTVPRNSYEPKEAEPPYEFVAPIDGDYEVVGYHLHDFDEGATIPKASEKEAWTADIIEPGVYDVLLRLTNPENTTWVPEAGESHGDNYYVVVTLYAGFDREKAYPTFIDTEHTASGTDIRETLTLSYDATSFTLDTLFAEERPTAMEATYSIIKLASAPNSRADFIGEEWENTISDAGYYGIIVTLNDPFLFEGTGETVAYYLVVIQGSEEPTLDGIEFKDKTVEYDGQPHKLTIDGVLPEGYSVTYEGNNGYNGEIGAIEPNVYTVTAIISDNDGEVARKEAKLTITKIRFDMSDVKFDDKTFTYDGAKHSLEVQGLPEGVNVTYTDNEYVEVGEYEVTATFAVDADHYEIPAPMTATLTIVKAAYNMEGVTFEDKSFRYDGRAHDILVGGDLPAGVNVTYSGNGRIEVGSYTVTATFTVDDETHYEVPAPMTATLTIEDSGRDLVGITFENGTVTYDGDPHSIYITGTPSDGIMVTYENNGQTEPGIYTVTAIFSDVTGEFERKTATLTILKTSLELKDENGNTTLIVDSEDGFDPALELALERADDNITRTFWAWEKDEISEKFTIKFMKDGAEVLPDGKITVRVLVPEEWRDKDFMLQGVGRAAAVEFTRDGDYVVFEAEGLSAFAFTMDGIAYLPILLAATGILLLCLGTLIVLAIIIKKNKKGE